MQTIYLVMSVVSILEISIAQQQIGAGLGSKIMKRLIELSALEGAACIKADVFIENKRALKFLEALGAGFGAG